MHKPTQNTTVPSWQPLGEALLDYQNGSVQAHVTIRSSIEYDRLVPVSAFYRQGNDFPKLEKQALQKCKGKVLDIGAGAGSHTLFLQKKGMDVTAIDVNPLAVEVMQMRGVQHSVCTDIYSFEGGKFDTILMMMNGIGVAQDLNGLAKLLEHLKGLLNPGGQILFDSTDISYVSPDDKAFASLRKHKGTYYGTVFYELEYKGKCGEVYPWLFIDKETLMTLAESCGYHCHIAYEMQDQYLARLFL